MKKALILYQSKTGITEKFGKEISTFITSRGVEAKAVSINDYQSELTEQADYLLLGCWTAGFMLMFQHPDLAWKQFAGKLPPLKGKKVALFTTYKIATGSMFKSMKKHLDAGQDFIELRSKKGNLSDEQKVILERFLEN
jgi:flavodoxin